MSIREEGRAFFVEQFGRELPEPFAVSKFYPQKESWTNSPVWWFDLSLEKLHHPNCDEIYLLCKEKNSRTFHCFRVSVSFLLENLNSFAVVHHEAKGERLHLYLSARSDNLFHELRGSQNIDFTPWLLDQ